MKRGFRLREYHERVQARLKELTESAVESEVPSLLGLEAGGSTWLVELSAVSEVLPLPPTASVPLTHPWFRGMANIRGTLYGVADLSAFLGGAPTPAGNYTRLVIPHARLGINCGLLVSRVLGLRSTDRFEQVPAQPDAMAWTMGQLKGPDGRLWTLLNLPQLLRTPEFLNIALFSRRNMVARATPGA